MEKEQTPPDDLYDVLEQTRVRMANIAVAPAKDAELRILREIERKRGKLIDILRAPY